MPDPQLEPSLFPGFEVRSVPASSDVDIACILGGSGPPLLLLHGHPQTHAIWHRVAPALAGHSTLVLADLRGYGDSSKPVGSCAGSSVPDSLTYPAALLPFPNWFKGRVRGRAIRVSGRVRR